MSPPRVFRRSDGVVVHLQLPGYQPSARSRSTDQAMCGAYAWAVRNGGPVPVVLHDGDLPDPDLRWCPTCVGRAAEHTGQLAALAASVVPRLLEEVAGHAAGA